FGNASEIREKIGELAQEKLTCETVDEGGVRALLSDNVEKLLVNEKQSFVLNNDPEIPLINDSRKIDRHLVLDLVEHGEHGILSEDAADECNGVPSASEEESQVDDDKVVVVSTIIPESKSYILSDQNSDTVGEVDEKVDDGHNGRNG
ncbi:hypothetical protein SESBI_46740, partial [Sesbania bispinosa]